MVRGGVVDQLPEVRPHGGLAAADVDVEDLHPLQLVDHRLGTRRWSAHAGRAGPSDDRQCTHDRLQAYVSSQVRQIGASRPRWNCSHQPASRCLTGSQRDHRRRGQRGQRGAVGAAARRSPHAGGAQAARALGCVSSAAHHLEQRRALQERQPAGAEVVEQRPEPLRAGSPPAGAAASGASRSNVAGRRRLSRHRTCRRSRPPRPAPPR